LNLLTTSVPDSVHIETSSTVIFTAGMKSLAMRYRGGRCAPFAIPPGTSITDD
jgi:hypothetical protein